METQGVLSYASFGHKLDGQKPQNYLKWSQSVFMFISGKGKEYYLIEAIVSPPETGPQNKRWKSENHMVKSWLINTMDLEIGQNFLLYTTAKEIWNSVIEIKHIIHNMQQGETFVTQYFNNLTHY